MQGVSNRTLRVLCFGDSLTKGYIGGYGGISHASYSDRLGALLREHHGEKTSVLVDNEGVNGELVIESMRGRLKSILETAQRKSIKYNWIVICGGTNDLGHGKDGGTLLKAICELHDVAKSFGAHTAAVSIPQFGLEMSPDHKALHEKKLTVNTGLKDYCSGSNSSSVFVDMYNELPNVDMYNDFPNISKEIAKNWSDYLHPSALGYQRFGEIVFQCLKVKLLCPQQLN